MSQLFPNQRVCALIVNGVRIRKDYIDNITKYRAPTGQRPYWWFEITTMEQSTELSITGNVTLELAMNKETENA